MKTILTLALLLFAEMCNLTAQNANNTQNTLKQLLAITEEKMKAKGLDFPEAVAENSSVLGKIPEFKNIESRIDVFWEEGIKSLDTAAPSLISKIIFFKACQNIAPGKYIAFLSETAELCEQGKLSRDLLVTAIFPDNSLRYILADNYKETEVITFCRRARKIWANDPAMLRMFDAILSGQTKKSIDNMRRAGALSVPESFLLHTNLDSLRLWIVAGAIVLIAGGLFASKKFSKAK